mgnify:CR=1 FL=1
MGNTEVAIDLVKYLARGDFMSENHIEPGHGDSVAAWTTVIIVIVAFAVALSPIPAICSGNAPMNFIPCS